MSTALSSGCGIEGSALEDTVEVYPIQDIEAGQGEAVSIILRTFGRAGPGPVIRWQRRLDCALGTGWRHNAAHPCVRGLHREGVVTIAIWPGAELAQTSLAHEVCHWANWVRGGDGDPAHAGPCFTEGGMVDEANAALWESPLVLDRATTAALTADDQRSPGAP